MLYQCIVIVIYCFYPAVGQLTVDGIPLIATEAFILKEVQYSVSLFIVLCFLHFFVYGYQRSDVPLGEHDTKIIYFYF